MSTTLNKLEYLDETKSQIKTALNQFGSGITTEDTFRSYVGKINNIYNNWPKVTGTGENVTLNNTKKGKMILLPGGNTFQDGEPTPTNEVPIHNVSGHNEFLVRNKNFLNRITCEENKLIRWGYGDTSNETGSLVSDFIRINVEENIFCSFGCQKAFYDENKDYIGILKNTGIIAPDSTNANTSNSFTVPNVENVRYVRLGFRQSYSPSVDLLNANIMVNKGESLATPYVPHKEQTAGFTLVEGQKMYAGDYLADDGIHHKYTKVILDGSEPGWAKNTITIETNAYTCKPSFINGRERGNIMCNYLKKISSASGTGIFNGLSINICFESSDFDTVEKLKAWISTNNLEVVYELENEIVEPYTETQQAQYNAIKQAMSYDEQTNITQTNDDLPFIISASALMKGGN